MNVARLSRPVRGPPIIDATCPIRPYQTSGLLFVLVAANVHNFAGVTIGLLFALATGEFRGGRIAIGGFAGAFLVIAAYIGLRALLPSPVSRIAQFEEVVRVGSFAVIASAASRMRIGELLRAVTAFLSLMACLYPVYLLTGWFGVADSSGAERFAGIMPHANHLGYVSASTAVTLAYLKVARDFQFRGYWLFLTICIALVVVTRSSGAFLLLTAGLALIPVSVRPTIRRIILSLVGSLIVIGLAMSPIGQTAVDKLQGFDIDTMLARARRYEFGNQGSSFAWRMSYWLAMTRTQIESGPIGILFGQGGGSTTSDLRVFVFMTRDAHSDFVRIFIEYGAIGLILCFGLLVRPVLRAGAKLVGLVVFFGPMLAGNSLMSSPVIIMLIAIILIVEKVNRE